MNATHDLTTPSVMVTAPLNSGPAITSHVTPVGADVRLRGVHYGTHDTALVQRVLHIATIEALDQLVEHLACVRLAMEGIRHRRL